MTTIQGVSNVTVSLPNYSNGTVNFQNTLHPAISQVNLLSGTVVIDDPLFNNFNDSGLWDSDDVLIQTNHCIKTKSPHCLTIDQTKQLIALVHRYNKYKIDIRVKVNQDGMLIIKSWRGETKLKYKVEKEPQTIDTGLAGINMVTYNSIVAIKKYSNLERVHWFNFIYYDLCNYVFNEIMQPTESLGALVTQFRRDIIDNIEPGFMFQSDSHPITYLYNLVIKEPVNKRKPRKRKQTD